MGVTGSTEAKPAGEDLSLLKGYTTADVALHCTDNDLWIIVHDKIYDMSTTNFEHPGGRNILLNVGGKDATEDFEEAQHSNTARNEMKGVLVGKLIAGTTTTGISSVQAAPTQSNAECCKTTTTTTEKKDACGSSCACVKPTTETDDAKKGECGVGCGCVEEEEEFDGCSPAPAEYTGPAIILPSVLVLYGSQGGRGKKLAENLADILRSLDRYTVTLSAMNDYEPEDIAKQSFVCYICSTHQGGTPPTNAKHMYAWLEDASTDFRIPKGFFSQIQYAVFGLGSTDYDENFNVCATKISAWNKKLGGYYMCKDGVADDSKDDADKVFNTWITKSFLPAFERKRVVRPIKSLDYEYDDGEDPTAGSEGEGSEGEGLVDLEDLGGIIKKGKQEKDDEKKGVRKEMLTDKNREALTKQGYKLIGSHSGVKLCRWTKAMLRGRGGCYKHSFYGISSYQCMEMTPSLACANKCVFCWRHHTNPTGKEWKWVMDEPEMIIEQAVDKHRQMIKQMKGVPGVQPDRYEQAFTVKHCALSLVGEPIMYPKINEYLKLLHAKHISSFLVTNAQFPDRIEQLSPVSQLYVSVDASTPDALKEVDRPLFTDYWERFIACLKALKSKQVRTVYRMTLVKAFNMGDIAEYAKLVGLGKPTFIEIKGVTFCGGANGDSMTMKNVPFHQEVRNFCQELVKYLDGQYEISCEHAHSCCILISDVKLKKDGVWHTWIDYPKFNQLVTRYYESGEMFTDMDYTAPTPSWAVYGAEEEGFDPVETRFYRKGKGGVIEQDD